MGLLGLSDDAIMGPYGNGPIRLPTQNKQMRKIFRDKYSSDWSEGQPLPTNRYCIHLFPQSCNIIAAVNYTTKYIKDL